MYGLEKMPHRLIMECRERLVSSIRNGTEIDPSPKINRHNRRGADVARRNLFKVFAAALALSAMAPNRAHAFLFPLGGTSLAQLAGYGVFNVKDPTYGAVGDGVMLIAGAIATTGTSKTFSDSGAAFTSADIGKVICVPGAGAAGVPLVTTIASINSSTSVELTAACSTTVTGKIVHYGTDDTTAIQAAITACYTAGGGIVFFPLSIYIVNGALQNASDQNAQLIIPYNAEPSKPVSMAFVGVTAPTINVGSLVPTSLTYPIAKGSILFSPLNGSGTYPAMIAAHKINTSFEFSNVAVTVANMVCRTSYRSSAPLQVLQFNSANYLYLENVTVDVDQTTAQQNTAAPITGGAGISTPGVNNGALSGAVNIMVTGYHTGVSWGEHFEMKNSNVHFCSVAYQVNPSYHALVGLRIGAYRCTTNILPGGALGGANKVPLNIVHFMTEHSGSGWCDTSADVSDGSNVIYGKMTYQVVTGGVGYDNADFVKTGGSNFTCTALF